MCALQYYIYFSCVCYTVQVLYFIYLMHAVYCGGSSTNRGLSNAFCRSWLNAIARLKGDNGIMARLETVKSVLVKTNLKLIQQEKNNLELWLSTSEGTKHRKKLHKLL